MSQSEKFFISEKGVTYKDVIDKPTSIEFPKEDKREKLRLVQDKENNSIDNEYRYIKNRSLSTREYSDIYLAQDKRSKKSNREMEESKKLSAKENIQFQDIDTPKILENLEYLNQSFREMALTITGSGSNNGGNGGDMGMLERRVESLEKKTEQIEKMVYEISNKMASVEITIRNSSTKEDIHRLEMSLTKTIHDAITALPKESQIKNIIREVNKSDEIINKATLKQEITSSRNQLIVWIVGVAIAVGGIISRMI